MLYLEGGAGPAGTKTPEPHRGSLYLSLLRTRPYMSPMEKQGSRTPSSRDQDLMIRGSIFLLSQRKRAAPFTSCKQPCCDTAWGQVGIPGDR